MHSLRGEPRRSYGRSFEARNLRRMMQFAKQFPDFRDYVAAGHTIDLAARR